MEEGLGPDVVAAAGELSQEEEGELGPQALVVVGPAVVLVDIWGLAAKEWESLVPAYISSSISVRSLEVEMLERGIMCLVSGAVALVFLVAEIQCLAKVFKPLHFFHVLCCSLILNCFKLLFSTSIYTPYTIIA